jgi:uncharacterized membrane protein SirB2
MYETIKLIHITSAAISIAGFFVRGLWMLADSPMGTRRGPRDKDVPLADSPRLQERWVRIAPHVIDTILLASAIYLAVTSQQYPGVHPWLTAKVVALVAYVLLGTIALKRGKTRRIRRAAWLGALATFAYIVGVALTRNPTVLL